MTQEVVSVSKRITYVWLGDREQQDVLVFCVEDEKKSRIAYRCVGVDFNPPWSPEALLKYGAHIRVVDQHEGMSIECNDPPDAVCGEEVVCRADSIECITPRRFNMGVVNE